MRNQKGYTLFELFLLFVVIFGSIGWIMNLYKVVTVLSCSITLETIFRLISVFFFPIGAILGYFPNGSGC